MGAETSSIRKQRELPLHKEAPNKRDKISKNEQYKEINVDIVPPVTDEEKYKKQLEETRRALY